MKKVAMTAVGVLVLAGSANAQGTWYTNKALWQSLVSNVQTANYTGPAIDYGFPESAKLIENGVTAQLSQSGNVLEANNGALRTYDTNLPITFTFSGNGFFGEFATANGSYDQAVGSIDFSIDGSLTNKQSLTTSASNYTFLGYISDSAAPISVRASPSSTTSVRVDSFSFGQSTSSLGANVAPEPGTLALALTGGCALLEMFIRRRKAA